MTSIERNFNGTVYRVTVKEEERRMRMEDSTLQEAMVLEETESTGGPLGGLEEFTVISLEVKVGQERGVLLQRWQQDGGEEEGEQQVNVRKKFAFSKDSPISTFNNTIPRCATPRRDWAA